MKLKGMEIKMRRLLPVLLMISLLVLPSCFNDDDNKNNYSEWRELNRLYFDSLSMATQDGQLVYTSFTPVWDNSFAILLKWHNDRSETNNEITPLSTSTCAVKYTLTNISGDTLDHSNSFSCVPNNMITGFMAALTQMHVNDTVTAVIPYIAGYGAYGSNSVRPYSTLIFGIRLDSITKLM